MNRRGGDVTLVHLPEKGIRGNTHFPFSDLNNLEIADLMSEFLQKKKPGLNAARGSSPKREDLDGAFASAHLHRADRDRIGAVDRAASKVAPQIRQSVSNSLFSSSSRCAKFTVSP